jgi:hypothetical protein
MDFLSIESDAKTVKGIAYGVSTAVQYMAPASISGYEVCPNRSHGCTLACLYESGHGVQTAVKAARIRRTVAFFQNRDAYALQLEREITAHGRRSLRLGLTPAVRMNGTSDLPWERIPLPFANGRATLLERFPDVTFYDYTKSVKRALTQPYNLTFSRSESNQADSLRVLANGTNVAVVFNVSARKQSDGSLLPLPQTWEGYPVIDGDQHDARFLDQQGAVVGLRSKGKATKDLTGFVVTA